MYKRSSPALASSHASPALRCIPRQAEIICLAYNETAKDGITRHRLGLQVSPLRVLLSLSTLAYSQPDTSSTTFAMNALLLSHDQARTLSYRYALSRSYASHRIASHRTNKDPRIQECPPPQFSVSLYLYPLYKHRHTSVFSSCRMHRLVTASTSKPVLCYRDDRFR